MDLRSLEEEILTFLERGEEGGSKIGPIGPQTGHIRPPSRPSEVPKRTPERAKKAPKREDSSKKPVWLSPNAKSLLRILSKIGVREGTAREIVELFMEDEESYLESRKALTLLLSAFGVKAGKAVLVASKLQSEVLGIPLSEVV